MIWSRWLERVIDDPRQKHFFDRNKDATCVACSTENRAIKV